MKKAILAALLSLVFLTAPGQEGSVVSAREKDTVIHNGIYIDSFDVSGMDVSQAKSRIDSYVDSLREEQFTLVAVDGNEVTVSGADLGICWKNRGVVDEAFELGKQGNILKRYKALKDLEKDNKRYPLEITADTGSIETVLTEQCVPFDKAARDAVLIRSEGGFTVEEGHEGEKLDVDLSVKNIKKYIESDWDRTEARLTLDTVVEEPRGKTEELKQIKDVLGTFTTSFKTSSKARSANVSNGCKLVNGTTVYPGDEFSMLEHLLPFSESNGYSLAGSYLNGTVVDTLGGGICQVSSTLYNAVLRAELEVTVRSCHSMEVTYVIPSADAAIAESSGKDFKFVNSTDYPIYLEGIIDNKTITFNIYGVETRDPSRKITFQSETLQETLPDSENIIADASLPIGYVKVQSVHVGRKAQLWKIVSEGGQEIERKVINQSSYKMVPRTATVGIATQDPAVLALMQQAIASGSIDHVKEVAKALTTPVITTETAVD